MATFARGLRLRLRNSGLGLDWNPVPLGIRGRSEAFALAEQGKSRPAILFRLRGNLSTLRNLNFPETERGIRSYLFPTCNDEIFQRTVGSQSRRVSPRAPPPGALDIRQVLSSLYFFA